MAHYPELVSLCLSLSFFPEVGVWRQYQILKYLDPCWKDTSRSLSGRSSKAHAIYRPVSIAVAGRGTLSESHNRWVLLTGLSWFNQTPPEVKR